MGHGFSRKAKEDKKREPRVSKPKIKYIFLNNPFIRQGIFDDKVDQKTPEAQNWEILLAPDAEGMNGAAKINVKVTVLQGMIEKYHGAHLLETYYPLMITDGHKKIVILKPKTLTNFEYVTFKCSKSIFVDHNVLYGRNGSAYNMLRMHLIGKIPTKNMYEILEEEFLPKLLKQKIEEEFARTAALPATEEKPPH